MSEDWSVSAYYARVRASELKPTTQVTVYEDPEGTVWNVPDPNSKTPAQRRAIFEELERRRGRG